MDMVYFVDVIFYKWYINRNLFITELSAYWYTVFFYMPKEFRKLF
jgi:hypothetical protein